MVETAVVAVYHNGSPISRYSTIYEAGDSSGDPPSAQCSRTQFNSSSPIYENGKIRNSNYDAVPETSLLFPHKLIMDFLQTCGCPGGEKLLSVFVIGRIRDGTGGFNRIKPDERLGSDGPSAVFAITRNSYSPFGFKFSTEIQKAIKLMIKKVIPMSES